MIRLKIIFGSDHLLGMQNVHFHFPSMAQEGCLHKLPIISTCTHQKLRVMFALSLDFQL